MELCLFSEEFAVCQLEALSDFVPEDGIWFLARTDEEISLVCYAQSVPKNAVRAEAPWRMLRIDGTLDFSLIGILAKLSGLLAEAGIPIFAVSTYNTDYLLVKAAQLPAALHTLRGAGHTIREI